MTNSGGVTPSERYLVELARRTFLSLWSFPNVYRAEGLNGARKKELADLLVVCGEDVIVFPTNLFTMTASPERTFFHPEEHLLAQGFVAYSHLVAHRGCPVLHCCDTTAATTLTLGWPATPCTSSQLGLL